MGVSANATLKYSSVADNSTQGDTSFGGGLTVGGDAILTGSTVSGNHTEGDQGAIGGLYVQGNATLTRSTVSGNSTQGLGSIAGGMLVQGDLTMNNSTIANNVSASGADGVQVSSAATFTADNSIIAQSGAGEEACSATTPVTLGGSGLFTDTSCNGIATPLNAIKLDSLAFNGGPTQTHALQAGSVAIDQGNNATCESEDQRGVLRTQNGDGDGSAPDLDGGCDIGSFEALPAGSGFDLGDAPDPTYPTLLANNGAAHVATGLKLGASRDTETDGRPSINATRDGADEDGVTNLPASLVAGGTANITVTASAAGVLNAWVDFNNDGDWKDADEQVFTDKALVAGSNPLSFMVPATAFTNFNLTRFRLTAPGETGIAPNAITNSGEVEDYHIGAQASTGGGGCTVSSRDTNGMGWLALLLSGGMFWRWCQRRSRAE